MPKIDKDKRRGIIGTIIVHILVIISLFLIALRTPLPLPGEEGVEINFGYDEKGFGNIQSETPPPTANPTPPKVVQPQPQPEPEPIEQEEEIIDQNIEETPVIEETVEEKPEEPKEIEKEPKNEPDPIEEKNEEITETPIDSTIVNEEIVEEAVEAEPTPVVNKRALYQGNANNTTQGTNQGIAGGIGDQGKPEGFKDSDKYDGRGGKGNGTSFYLGGRGNLYLEEPKTDFKEQGTVVVSIWVDRNGNVQKAQVKAKGTDILDQNLRQLSVKSAKNSKFESDPTAEELQRGTITYKFVLLK